MESHIYKAFLEKLNMTVVFDIMMPRQIHSTRCPYINAENSYYLLTAKEH